MLGVRAVGVRRLKDYTDYNNVITVLSRSEQAYNAGLLSVLDGKERLVIEANDYDYDTLLSSGEFFDDVFTKEHARQVIEFALKHRDEPILVHCASGISRSQAVALFIAKHIKKDNNLFNVLYHDDLKIEGGNLLIYRTLSEVGYEYMEVSGSKHDSVSGFFF